VPSAGVAVASLAAPRFGEVLLGLLLSRVRNRSKSELKLAALSTVLVKLWRAAVSFARRVFLRRTEPCAQTKSSQQNQPPSFLSSRVDDKHVVVQHACLKVMFSSAVGFVFFFLSCGDSLLSAALGLALLHGCKALALSCKDVPLTGRFAVVATSLNVAMRTYCSWVWTLQL
jgi:hypothetical protein